MLTNLRMEKNSRTLIRKCGFLLVVFFLAFLFVTSWNKKHISLFLSIGTSNDETNVFLGTNRKEKENYLFSLSKLSNEDIKTKKIKDISNFLNKYEGKKLLHQTKNHINCEIISRSSLNSLSCNNTAAEVMPLLITGTGRSGTEYIQKLLNNLGLRLAHDTIGPDVDGGVSWPQAFNEKVCKKIEWNWLRDVTGKSTKGRTFRFDHVLQVVRDPLKQVLSRANKGGFTLSDNKRYTSCATDLKDKRSSSKERVTKVDESILFALRHWVLFNSFIESYVSYTFRIEDMTSDKQVEVVKDLFRYGGFSNKIPNKKSIENEVGKLSSQTHRSHTKKVKGMTLSWHSLYQLDKNYATLAQIMAIRYGYFVAAEELLPDVIIDCEGTYLLRQTNCYFLENQKWHCDLLDPVCVFK